MKYLLSCLLCICSLAIYAQHSSIQKEKWHWDDPSLQDTEDGYVQVVKVDHILYISGVVASEFTTEAITQLYQNLERSLNSFGATFQNVVKENLYTTDIEAMKNNNDARKAFYHGDYPAATWVQISRLFTEDAKIEVELIAHLKKE